MAIYKDLRYKVGVTIGAASSGASQVLLKKVMQRQERHW